MPDTIVAPPPPVSKPATPAPSTPAPKPAESPASTPLKPGESRFQQSIGKLREGLKDATVDGQPQPKAAEAKSEPKQEPPPNRPGATDPKPDAPPKDAAKPEGEKPVVEGEPEKAIDPKATPKGEKLPGPWQLKEKYEKLAKLHEQRAVEAETKLAKLGDYETISKRAQQAEERAKKYEEEIKYLDYSKSEEFQEKYQKPYLDAWAKAEREITQLNVTDAEGNVRKATVQDFLALANMPAGDSDVAAESWFGKSAQRVLRHVDKMRDLSEAQQKALDDARKTGSERMTQQSEASKMAREEASQLWSEHVQADDEKHEFLKPKEEDNEWNEKLEKARSFVEETIKGNAADPKLTKEQRAELIRKKTALRGRAIGFTMRGLEIARLKSQIALKDAEIAEIKAGSPGAGNGRNGNGDVVVTYTDPMERSKAALRQRLQGVQ